MRSKCESWVGTVVTSMSSVRHSCMHITVDVNCISDFIIFNVFHEVYIFLFVHKIVYVDSIDRFFKSTEKCLFFCVSLIKQSLLLNNSSHYKYFVEHGVLLNSARIFFNNFSSSICWGDLCISISVNSFQIIHVNNKN